MQDDPRQPTATGMGSQQPVLILTIGGIRAIVRGVTEIWAIKGMGVPQLKQMLSYMVTFPGRAMHWTTLAAIGSKRWTTLVKPRNLPWGVRTLLHRWDMGAALHESDGYFTLQRHPSWISDTDLIERHMLAAQQASDCDDDETALAELQQAVHYCGGPYLPDYDAPEYDLEDAPHHWETYQREAIHRLARARLQRNEPQIALAAARKVALIGPSESADADLFADIYDALGNTRMATMYRQKARRQYGLDP